MLNQEEALKRVRVKANTLPLHKTEHQVTVIENTRDRLEASVRITKSVPQGSVM